MRPPTEKPSERQLLVLSMAANGRSREEIGRELFLSPETIKKDLDSARETLRAVNVTHAVSLCIAHGFLCVAHNRIATLTPLVAAHESDLASAPASAELIAA